MACSVRLPVDDDLQVGRVSIKGKMGGLMVLKVRNDPLILSCLNAYGLPP
jgi:hypothetical protein